MPKRLYDTVLLQKLAKKIGKSEKYIREQISRRAKGFSPAAYFVYWLTKAGVPSVVYQRSLSDSIKDETRTLLQQNQPSKIKTTTAQKIRYAKKIFKIKELDIQAKPPLLPNNLISDAHGNAEVYQALFIFENSIRYFIISVLEKKYGKNWWNTDNIVNNDIKQKVCQRLEDETINAFHSRRGVHEIFYTDFTELSTIIKNNAGVFNPLFAGIKGRVSFLTQKLEELAMSRNTIAHTCPLKKKDRDRFLLYFQDWYDQIDIINSRL